MVRLSPNSRIRRILVVGSDVSQLSSGANLLTQAGYTTDVVVTIDRAMRRANAGRYHLAIISKTFAYEEQLAILAHLRTVKPSLPVLLLGPEHDSPSAFLDSVSACLGRPKTPDIAAHLSERAPDELAEQ
jgi:DNA-binding NtrC family response regulator